MFTKGPSLFRSRQNSNRAGPLELAGQIVHQDHATSRAALLQHVLHHREHRVLGLAVHHDLGVRKAVPTTVGVVDGSQVRHLAQGVSFILRARKNVPNAYAADPPRDNSNWPERRGKAECSGQNTSSLARRAIAHGRNRRALVRYQCAQAADVARSFRKSSSSTLPAA